MKTWKVLAKRLDLNNKHKVDAILAVLMSNRGIKTTGEIKEFLNPNLKSVTPESVGIKKTDIKRTLDRIQLAIKNNEGIVIYGDYDVDGICGTAVLWETIYAFYKNVYPYIPHRIDEGYGLSKTGIKNLKLKIKNCSLIITVDNGIVASDAVEYARIKNIDVIVTDHHVKGSVLPRAHSIVHTTKLCGTGVAYLLSQKITERLESRVKDLSKSSHLELVAMATVADLVPLNKHNRVLLKFGLEKLRKTKRVGLLELFKEAKIDPQKIGVYEVGHIIAPRLNASGRISHAMDSLRLICTTDSARARKLAQTLGEVNRERQQLTFDSSENAKNLVLAQKLGTENIIIVANKTYEQGVVGLIASRLVEEFYRPAIAVSVGEKFSKGSARSISGVNIIELIRLCSEFLTEAGGHPMAAGFTVENINLPAFREAIVKKARKIDKKLFARVLKIDLDLPFDLIDTHLADAILTLEPFGMGNMSPVFATRGVTVISMKRVGQDGQHVQAYFEKEGIVKKAIIFRFDSNKISIGGTVDIAYTIEKNDWRGKISVDLKIKDVISK